MKNKITTNNAALPADPRERDELLSLFQEIREGIESHVEIMRAAWEKGKPYAVKVGVLLIKAKKAAKAQGLDWIPLVEAHCCDKRTAQRYMRLAEHKDDPRLIAAEEDAKCTVVRFRLSLPILCCVKRPRPTKTRNPLAVKVRRKNLMRCGPQGWACRQRNYRSSHRTR